MSDVLVEGRRIANAIRKADFPGLVYATRHTTAWNCAMVIERLCNQLEAVRSSLSTLSARPWTHIVQDADDGRWYVSQTGVEVSGATLAEALDALGRRGE